MASETTIATARALIDGLQAHDLSRWAEALADSFTAEYPGAAGLNREQARMFNQSFLDAFLDLRFDIHRVIADGDCVAIHWTGSGTHSAPLATMSGQVIPPTGRRGAVSGVFIVEVKDGKIVSERSYWDQITLLTQLGLMPAA
jgi:predicted ester cyclase